MTFVIGFSPPMMGFSGSFNTIRLGGAWAKRVSGGERILLMDIKNSAIFGSAVVEKVVVGKLNEVAIYHAANNHNQKDLDAGGAPERLIAGFKKRYGPAKCSDTSKVTIIYMRLQDEKDHFP